MNDEGEKANQRAEQRQFPMIERLTGPHMLGSHSPCKKPMAGLPCSEEPMSGRCMRYLATATNSRLQSLLKNPGQRAQKFMVRKWEGSTDPAVISVKKNQEHQKALSFPKSPLFSSAFSILHLWKTPTTVDDIHLSPKPSSPTSSSASFA